VQVNDYLGGMGISDQSGATRPTNATGWTERATFDNSGPDGQSGSYLDTIATGSDDFTWSWVSNETVMILGAWSGRNTASPRTAVQATVDNTGNATPVSASYTGVTAVQGDDIAVFLECDQSISGDDWSLSTITDYTEQQDFTGIQWITAGLQTRDNVTAGATGSLAVTITRDAGTGTTGYAGVVVAIASSSGAQPTSGRIMEFGALGWGLGMGKRWV
jgi:hypothetical protein